MTLHSSIKIKSKPHFVMPLIKSSAYRPPFYLFEGHSQTIVPGLFRNAHLLAFQRERISTPDDDFLDLDWLTQKSKQLIIISHGLEGNSQRPYMTGMAKAFYEQGWDALCWNFRGCSGEMNRQLRFYHSGATDDLDTVIRHALCKGYETVALCGFSLGGNLTLKYLGEQKENIPSQIKGAVAISVPVHLSSSGKKLSQRENIVYAKRFLKTLKEKVRNKAAIYPKDLPLDQLDRIKTLKDFDDVYTGPLHGFRDAEDYYQQCSALYFLEHIKVKTLLLNALNDPFLSTACYPTAIAQDLSNLYLEYPKHGGHVGFTPASKASLYYSEKRAVEFLTIPS